MSLNPVILVFGANGWIGSKVYNLLVNSNKPITVYKAQSRADDQESVENELNNYPNVVTHVMKFYWPNTWNL
jgi:UDP-glucose 4-epimerase